MLNTVEFGWIRIVTVRPCPLFAHIIDIDLGGEYEFWYTADNEIVAYPIDNN